MSKNTSVSLGPYFESFIQGRLKEGRYKNTSEIIRVGLRLLEEEEAKSLRLESAIQEGIDSGIEENFNPQIYLQELQSSRKK